MQELTGLLAEATAAILPGYFRLSIHGGAPIYRERVYCYELYHQMRLRWPNECPFTLNGEVDKAAHPILSDLGASGFKPDLLVHRPGDMGGNHTVLEVKSAQGAWDGFPKDLNTLSIFMGAVRYERAIYLVYGDERAERLPGRIRAHYEREGLTAPIELWLHVAAGEPAVHALTLQRANEADRKKRR